MPSIVAPTDLASYMGVTLPSDTGPFQAAIDAAQEAVEQWATGEAGSLTANTPITETIFTRRETDVLSFNHGPASALTAVKVNGVTQATFELLGLYGIRCAPTYPPSLYGDRIPAGAYVTVTYTQGWDNTSGWKGPAAIKKAILAEAATRANRPDPDMTRVTAGPLTYWFGPRNAEGRVGLSADAKTLLTAFRAPWMEGLA